MPIQWAQTQTGLGVALWSLGQRSSTKQLDEAVTAFREVLKVWTRAPILDDLVGAGDLG
jgi:hypothetical protein